MKLICFSSKFHLRILKTLYQSFFGLFPYSIFLVWNFHMIWFSLIASKFQLESKNYSFFLLLIFSNYLQKLSPDEPNYLLIMMKHSCYLIQEKLELFLSLSFGIFPYITAIIFSFLFLQRKNSPYLKKVALLEDFFAFSYLNFVRSPPQFLYYYRC